MIPSGKFTRAGRLAVLVLLLMGLSGPGQAAVEPSNLTLAALDIGSGTTRLLVAELDVCGGHALRVVERKSARVPYAADLLNGETGSFSADIQARADQTMAGLIAQARDLGSQRVLAVATQAFRTAANGEDLLQGWRERHGLEVSILTQEEEARLAYQLVVSRLGAATEHLLVWDIGAASQQLVWRDPVTQEWVHVNSDLASVTFRNHSLDTLGRPVGWVSPNPISQVEADLLAAEVMAWLGPGRVDRVNSVTRQGFHVVGIGGVHGASLVNQMGLQPGEWVTRSALARTLAGQLGRSDEAIGGEYADTDVTNLILVNALMAHYGIDRYQVKGSDLTEAVLLALDEDCQLFLGPRSSVPAEANGRYHDVVDQPGFSDAPCLKSH